MSNGMYIIDVVPLALIPHHQDQILSYFHATPLPTGAVVEVPLNRRKIKGVVVGSATLRQRKLDFKKNVGFELKNILRVVNAEPIVAVWQLELASFLSNQYYAPLGLCLKTVLPSLGGIRNHELRIRNKKSTSQQQKFVFTNLQNHSQDYQQFIQTVIKRWQSVFLLVPENIAAQYFVSQFTELKPVVISSALTKKAYRQTWDAVAGGQAKLVIGTRVGLFLPFRNLGLVIVDDEANEHYKSDMTPRYFAPTVAEEIARLHGAELIFSAVVPRLETAYNFEILNSSAGRDLAQRDKSKTQIISMVDELRAGNFSIFSRDLKEKLSEVILNKSKLVIFIPRRGQANYILCETCGQTIRCPNCSVSLVPHDAGANLHCHHCNYQQPKPKQCLNCQSYNLKTHGIGIEKVMAELTRFYKYQNLLPPKLLRLDSDVTKTDAKELELMADFGKNEPAIFLATQMLFSHKYLLKVPLICIINADALVYIPDFRSEEMLFRQTAVLAQMTDRLLIQTYNPDNPALQLATDGKLKDFFDAELANREVFAYPPFSELVKLTYRQRDPLRAKREMMILYEKLNHFLKIENWKLEIELSPPFPAFISKERGLYVWNILIKEKVASAGEDKATANQRKIRNLEWLRMVPAGAGWTIDVDPRNAV